MKLYFQKLMIVTSTGHNINRKVQKINCIEYSMVPLYDVCEHACAHTRTHTHTHQGDKGIIKCDVINETEMNKMLKFDGIVGNIYFLFISICNYRVFN